MPVFFASSTSSAKESNQSPLIALPHQTHSSLFNDLRFGAPPPPDFMLFFYVYFRILTKQQHAAKSTFLVKLGFFNFDYFNLSKKILVFKGFFASSWIKFNSYFCFFRSCFSYHMPMEIQSNFLAK